MDKVAAVTAVRAPTNSGEECADIDHPRGKLEPGMGITLLKIGAGAYATAALRKLASGKFLA